MCKHQTSDTKTCKNMFSFFFNLVTLQYRPTYFSGIVWHKYNYFTVAGCTTICKILARLNESYQRHPEIKRNPLKLFNHSFTSTPQF